ncbi:MAG: serine/threonine protein kinase [Chloroflexi bacterium]|nr:serine/threonine protein kinase [Chloroflexota bacterium]
MPEQSIGRYVIKAEIGRGGMATVYHAYDPNFERDVAIKVLPTSLLHDPQFRARFEREAKMIALLEHPAIVPVYDFGEQDGQPYIVMRYMSGGSLTERIRQGAIPLQETCQILSRLAPALDAAHARGVIHRDIKPGNILFDQYGNAFLSDFGVARLTQEASLNLTGDGIVGTPAYMSPEQVQGDKAVDGRSDIYALGVVAFQMLTGAAPYQADTPAKTMLMHILEPVPQLLQKNASLPQGCEAVLACALAKYPEDRYPTSVAFAQALEAASLGLPFAAAASSDATIIGGQTLISARKTPLPPMPRPQQAAPQPPPKKKSAWLPWLLGGVAALLVLGLAAIAGGILFVGSQTGLPLIEAPADATWTAIAATPLPTSGQAALVAATELLAKPPASATPPPPSPTETPLPTETQPPPPTATVTFTPEPLAPVIGGADKVAYLSSSDIWAANLDGSDLLQLTHDQTVKSSLQWTPDGEAVTYISGKCLQIVHLANAQVETVVCFNFADSLKDFSISPDGSQAAVTLDNQMYLLPFDLAGLQAVTEREDLAAMAACQDFAPFLRNFITQVRWSQDSLSIAAKLIANLGNGLQGDIVQIFPIDQCTPTPKARDNFPQPRFEMPGYDQQPKLQNYSWDGVALFAFNSQVRNDGFGDLFIYNTEKYKVYPSVNPVNGDCCYRDPQWSPDGSYLLFAFQDRAGGSTSITKLYYVPYGSIGTGASYTPLPLPEITDPREKPQPALRPAQ